MSESDRLLNLLPKMFPSKGDIKSVDGRYALNFKKQNPERTYDEILKAIGVGKELLRPDSKSQIISMLKFESSWRQEQFNKVFWQEPNLNVWSMNIDIRMNDKEDQVLVTLTFCFVRTNLTAEWFWNKRTTANKCLL